MYRPELYRVSTTFGDFGVELSYLVDSLGNAAPGRVVVPRFAEGSV
jgi:hypothetical protein